MYCLITRPIDQSHEVAKLLKAKLISCIIDPLIIIQNITFSDQELNELFKQQFQAIIITSTNAIKALALITNIRSIKIIVVGQKTYVNAINLGFNDVVFGANNANDLTSFLINNLSPSNGTIFYPRADHITIDIATILVKCGFSVIQKIIYKSIAATKFNDQTIDALRRNKLEMAMFLSKRTAENFIQLISINKLQDKLINIKAFALSKNIATILESVKWKEINISPQPNLTALIELF
jgi:uroporphyrinogen-III synthase